MTEFKDAPKSRVLRWWQLKERIPISHSRVYCMMNEGTFPRTISLGERSVAWLESEIDEWLQERIDKRDNNDVGVGVEI